MCVCAVAVVCRNAYNLSNYNKTSNNLVFYRPVKQNVNVRVKVNDIVSRMRRPRRRKAKWKERERAQKLYYTE